MKTNPTTTTACDICGGTVQVKVRRFVLGGRVFEGPVCQTCSHCDQCGSELTVTEEGTVYCPYEPCRRYDDADTIFDYTDPSDRGAK